MKPAKEWGRRLHTSTAPPSGVSLPHLEHGKSRSQCFLTRRHPSHLAGLFFSALCCIIRPVRPAMSDHRVRQVPESASGGLLMGTTHGHGTLHETLADLVHDVRPVSTGRASELPKRRSRPKAAPQADGEIASAPQVSPGGALVPPPLRQSYYLMLGRGAVRDISTWAPPGLKASRYESTATEIFGPLSSRSPRLVVALLPELPPVVPTTPAHFQVSTPR